MERPTQFFDAYLFDLDGTIFLGDELLPGAARLVGELRRRRIPVRFLSNNATKAPEQYAEKLTRLGLPTDVADIANTVATMTRWLLANHPGKVVFPIAEQTSDSVPLTEFQHRAQISEGCRDDGVVRPLSALLPGQETSLDELLHVVAHRWLADAEFLGEVTGTNCFAPLGGHVGQQPQPHGISQGLQHPSSTLGRLGADRAIRQGTARHRTCAHPDGLQVGGMGEGNRLNHSPSIH